MGIDETELRIIERLLKPLEDRLDEHGDVLKEILAEAKHTNGTVRDHESRLQAIETARDSAAKRRVRWFEMLAGGAIVFLTGAEGPHVLRLIFG